MKNLQIKVENKFDYENIVKILSKYFRTNCDGSLVGKYPKTITLNLFWYKTAYFTNHFTSGFEVVNCDNEEFTNAYFKYLNTPIR